jgi:hypothetical protein
MKRFLVLFLLVTLANQFIASGQTAYQQTGWMMFMNNTKLNKKWGSYVDVQVRTTDNFKQVRNVLFRPGLTYYASPKHEITLGYLLNQTYEYPVGQDNFQLTEHRIWEQYVYKHKVKTIIGSHRFRLEQRFIERRGLEDLFAQRFRYFFRFIVPLQQDIANFEKGLFTAIQNEVFLNIQNKDQLNTHLFDQNRAYLAAGYRFSTKLDMELGYLNQSSKGRIINTLNSVVQVAVYTKF